MNVWKNAYLDAIGTLELIVQASCGGWADLLHVQSRTGEDEVVILSLRKGLKRASVPVLLMETMQLINRPFMLELKQNIAQLTSALHAQYQKEMTTVLIHQMCVCKVECDESCRWGVIKIELSHSESYCC